MIQICLFCENRGCKYCNGRGSLPEWWGGGSAQQKKYVRIGLHPTGQKLKENRTHESCGNCADLDRVGYRSRVYLKCKRTKQTRGPGTDMRAKWPACVNWSQDESDIPF